MAQTNNAQSNDNAAKAVRVPPHALDAERSVLGGLLIEPRAWDNVVDLLTEHDFYLPEHQVLFRNLEQMAKANKPLNVLTLSETLKQNHDIEKAGGEAYIIELANNTPSAANVTAYAQIVRDRSIQRQLLIAGQSIADLAYDPSGSEVQELLDQAEREIFNIAERGVKAHEGPELMTSVLARATDKIDELFHSKDQISGLPTGYKDLDEMTSGLHPGEMIVIAGRPSMGKTGLAMNIAEHAALSSKKPVLVFSLEMPNESLAMRMISSLGRVSSQRLRTGRLKEEDWPRIASAVSLLSEAKILIDDGAALTPLEMRSRARRVVRQHGELALIVVDYLQLMRVHGNSENRTNEISEISRSLKILAKELNVPLIALSQLNRSVEQRTDKRPVMSDLRESGAIEQDADLIAFIYRDEVYNDQTPDKGVAEIIIGKQRNGPIGKVRLAFMGEYTRFENFTSEQYVGHAPAPAMVEME